MKAFFGLLVIAALVFCASSATVDVDPVDVQGRMAMNTFRAIVANLRDRYAKVRAAYGLQIESIVYCVTPDIATESCLNSMFSCASSPGITTIPDCLNSVVCAGFSIKDCVARHWRV